MSTLASPAGYPMGHIKSLLVRRGGTPQVASGHFWVTDGGMQFLMASGANEQTAVLAALSGLPGAQVIQIQGGTYGGASATVTSHTSRVGA